MQPILTKFFKGMTKENISQIFHAGHPALDIISWQKGFTNGYGTPLCAPEMCRVEGITREWLEPEGSTEGIKNGYGIKLKGLETGYSYLFWHTLSVLPVNGGDIVKRGQIVAYMGNAGRVYSGGAYVPLEKRNYAPFPGTHLHIEMYDNGKQIDPLPFINFNWEPQYTLFENLEAIKNTLLKISRIINQK